MTRERRERGEVNNKHDVNMNGPHNDLYIVVHKTASLQYMKISALQQWLMTMTPQHDLCA